MVKIGAIMNMIAMIILSTVALLALLITLIGQFAASAPASGPFGRAGSGSSEIAGFMGICAFILLVAWRVLAIIGYAFYLSVPPRVDARNLAMVSLCTSIGSIGVGGLGFLVTYLVGRSATSMTGGQLTIILGITTIVVVCILILIEYTCGIIFARASSESLREHSLASNFTFQLISMWIISILHTMHIGIPLMLASFGARINLGPDTARLMVYAWVGCNYILMLAELGWCVWHTIGLFLFRGALDAPPRRGRD
jgi:hypothetical protein